MIGGTIGLIFLLAISQVSRSMETDTGLHGGQYSYIEVQFAGVTWDPNYDDSGSTEFQTLKDSFLDNVESATSIPKAKFYDVWFYQGTDTVKGELKVDTTDTEGIDESAVQTDLIDSPNFVDARVWTDDSYNNDDGGGTAQYSYIEVQFPDATWSAALDDSSTMEFETLKTTFISEVLSVTNFPEELFYDFWFFPGSDANGNNDPNIVKGEVKLNTTEMGDIDETQLQEDLEFSGYFIAVRVWTEGNDGNNPTESILLCGNLTFWTTDVIWKPAFSDKESDAFINFTVNLNIEIISKGDVPSFDNVEFSWFVVQALFEESGVVFANYLMALDIPPGMDINPVAKDLLESLDTVEVATIETCSPEVTAEFWEGSSAENDGKYYFFNGTAKLATEIWDNALLDRSSSYSNNLALSIGQQVHEAFTEYLHETEIVQFTHSIEDDKVIIEFNGIFKEVEGVFDVHDLENGLNDMLLFEWVTIMKDDYEIEISSGDGMNEADHFEGSVTLVTLWNDNLLNMDSQEFMDVRDNVITEINSNLGSVIVSIDVTYFENGNGNVVAYLYGVMDNTDQVSLEQMLLELDLFIEAYITLLDIDPSQTYDYGSSTMYDSGEMQDVYIFFTAQLPDVLWVNELGDPLTQEYQELEQTVLAKLGGAIGNLVLEIHIIRFFPGSTYVEGLVQAPDTHGRVIEVEEGLKADGYFSNVNITVEGGFPSDTSDYDDSNTEWFDSYSGSESGIHPTSTSDYMDSFEDSSDYYMDESDYIYVTLTVQLSQVPWNIALGDPNTIESGNLKQTVEAKLYEVIGDLMMDIHIMGFHEGSTYADVFGRVQDNPSSTYQIEERLNAHVNFSNAVVTVEGGMNPSDTSDYDDSYTEWFDSYSGSESGIHPTSTSDYMDSSDYYMDESDFDDYLTGSSDAFSTDNSYDSTMPTPPMTETDDDFTGSTDSMESTDTDYIGPTSTSSDDSTEMPEYQGPPWEGTLSPEIGSFVVEEDGKRKLALSCDCEIQDDFDYEISWYGDGNELYKTNRLTAAEARGYQVPVDRFDLHGQYALDLEYVCVVNVYSLNGDSVYTAYSESEDPVQAESTTIEIKRGNDANITAYFDLPLICQEDDECYIIIKATILDDDNSCSEPSLAVKGSAETCGIRIYGKHSGDEDIGEKTIKFILRNDDEQYVLGKTQFKARVEIETFGSVEKYFGGTFTEEIEFNVIDMIEDDSFWKGTHCYATNDPRHGTFDELIYSVNSIDGTFLMYKNEKKSAEVQITTQSCSGDWTSVKCICAVYIRNGKDVFAVNFCSPPFTSSYLQRTEKKSLYVVKESQGTFMVYFAHGTSVSISVLPPSTVGMPVVNVVIFPSPSDVRNTQGLCGTLDGDEDNDLKHRDGTTQTPVTVDDKGWQIDEPTAFAESFRVLAVEALDDENNLEGLEDVSDDESYCACTENKQVCSTNEKRTCNDRTDEYENAQTRRKRSTRAQEVEGFHLNRQEISRRMKLWKEYRSTSVTRKKRTTHDCPTVTREEARANCTGQLANVCGKVFVDTQAVKDHSDKIEACARDKEETCAGIPWEWAACNAALAVLKNEVLKNKEITDEDRSEIEDKILNCPNQCSGKGTCGASGCQCDSGYSDDDCSFNEVSPPIPDLIFSVEVETEFTPDAKPSKITLSALAGFSGSGKCKVIAITITLPGNEISEETLYFDLIRISYYEAECPIPTSSRRRRSTGSGSSSAVTTYQVSASNDGSTYGSSLDVAVLDNTCLSFNSTTNQVTLTPNYCLIGGVCYLNGVNKTGETCSYCDVSSNVYDWTLETGYCLIDDVCYTNGTEKSDDSCKLCHVGVETDEWTRDNETESCNESDDDGSEKTEGYIIAIIVLVVVFVLAGGAVGGYFLWKKYKLSKLRSIGLFDQVPRDKFSLRVEPSKKEMLKMEGIDFDPEMDEESNHPKPVQPPPLYITANLPVPSAPIQAAPDNLYTDRGTVASLGTLTPAMASSGQSERPHTPNMPNIEG